MNYKNDIQLNNIVITTEIVESDTLEKVKSLTVNFLHSANDGYAILDTKVENVGYVNEDWISRHFGKNYKDERILLILMSGWVLNQQDGSSVCDTDNLFSETYAMLYSESHLQLPNQGVYPNEGMGGGHLALLVESVFPDGVFDDFKFNYNRKPDKSVQNEFVCLIEMKYENDPHDFADSWYRIDEDGEESYEVPKLEGLKGFDLLIRKKERELIKKFLSN